MNTKKKRLKKILSFAGAVTMSLSFAAAIPQNGGADMFSITASAAEKIKVSGGTSVPSNIKVGQAVIVKGTVNSPETLTEVRVGVYNTSNKSVTGNYEKISSKTYDLHRLDKYVLFNKLEEGEYTYRVYAVTESGVRKLIVKQTFTVGNAKPSAANTDNGGASAAAAASTASTAKNPKNISNLTVDGITLKNGTALADHITKGKGVNVTGVLSADKNFSYVTVAVYDIQKKFVTGIKVLPNVNTYDLANTDKYVEFDKLTDGLYYYRITAAFDDGKEHVIVQKKFAVGTAVLTDEEPAAAKPVNISQEIDIDEENESEADDELVNVQDDPDIENEEDEELEDDVAEDDDEETADSEGEGYIEDEELEDEELEDEELELDDEEVVSQ